MSPSQTQSKTEHLDEPFRAPQRTSEHAPGVNLRCKEVALISRWLWGEGESAARRGGLGGLGKERLRKALEASGDLGRQKRKDLGRLRRLGRAWQGKASEGFGGFGRLGKAKKKRLGKALKAREGLARKGFGRLSCSPGDHSGGHENVPALTKECIIIHIWVEKGLGHRMILFATSVHKNGQETDDVFYRSVGPALASTRPHAHSPALSPARPSVRQPICPPAH
eukprot:366491-Chlamydomonas_euryale.AAC.9